MTGLAGLAPIIDEPATGALITDFDGTLAPIVEDPSQARPLPEALDALDRLVSRLALVAVVSGRRAEFLQAHVPVPGVVRVGVYGLERVVGDDVVSDPRAAPYAEAVERAAQEVAGRWPTLAVERKGTLSFTVHWRARPGDAPSPGALEQLARTHGLFLLPGRKAAELRVPVPVDKGTVVDSLLDEHRARAAAFCGDDTGDRAAFEALTRREVAGAGFVGIRVAVRSAEVPTGLVDAADVVVDAPAGLAELLGELAAAVTRPG